MKNPFYKLSFTSGTTNFSECVNALRNLNSKVDYIHIFHNKISSIYNSEYVYSYNAARMALYVILKAAGIGSGDEVILQGYTCAVVPRSIIFTGARPVYVDINEEDYNINLSMLTKSINAKTKAIIVQYTYGNPCRDIFKIKEICKEKNILLIEDCAHIIGGEIEGYKLGTIGDAAIISTDHTKLISTSIGGIAIINNPVLGKAVDEDYQKTPFLKKSIIRKIVAQFIIIELLYNKNIFKLGWWIARIYSNRITNLSFFMSDYKNVTMPSKYPFPSRLSNVQALIGLSQINMLEQNIEHRRKITRIYKEKLNSIIEKDYITNEPLRFPLKVKNRSELLRKLNSILKTETWFDSNLQGMPEEQLDKLQYVKGLCPIAEKISKEIINLPVHQKVSAQDALIMSNMINETLNRKEDFNAWL